MDSQKPGLMEKATMIYLLALIIFGAFWLSSLLLAVSTISENMLLWAIGFTLVLLLPPFLVFRSTLKQNSK